MMITTEDTSPFVAVATHCQVRSRTGRPGVKTRMLSLALAKGGLPCNTKESFWLSEVMTDHNPLDICMVGEHAPGVKST